MSLEREDVHRQQEQHSWAAEWGAQALGASRMLRAPSFAHGKLP